MPLIETKTGRKYLRKAESMMAVPYVYDATIGDYVLGQDVYDISAVIGDSIVIEQSEGNTETKYNEFVGSPLLECVSGGKFVFTAQCVDFQDAVLKSLFGAMVSGNGAAALNDDYVLIYALIRVRFKDESLPDVILPKAQLNSRLFIQQLKTRAGQGNIAATAHSLDVAIEDLESQGHLLQFQELGGKNTYVPYTPLVFVPHGYTPLFRHDGKNFSVVDFTTGSVAHNIFVNQYNGTWQVSSSSSGDNGQSDAEDDENNEE